jgi:hypothetical protein
LLFGIPNAKTPHEKYYYYHQDQLQAVRSGPWKLFLPIKPTGGHPHFKGGENETLLFNLLDDVSCQSNVASQHPDIVKRLMHFAEGARKDLGDKGRRGEGQRLPGKITIPEN